MGRTGSAAGRPPAAPGSDDPAPADAPVEAPAVAAVPASAARSRRLRICGPIIPSRAGVSVTAMSTAIATHSAPTVPMRPRNGMPVTLSASSAMSTVAPANTTALPDVPFASAIDSCSSSPCLSWRRCRLTMKSE
ncbi:Uncharacterised protein [Mycobacteroides abscessus]|nr:Uncharacterised protein [Mycobacteroides abscessus]